MPASMEHVIIWISELPLFIKLAILTLSVTIEYIFPVFPGDTIVLFAGFLNAFQVLDLRDTSLAIMAGTLLGSSIAYGLGRLLMVYQHKIRFLRAITASAAYEQFSRWYRKWGIWFLLFNRFFPGVRALFFFVAGAEKIHVGKVLFFGGLSALLYNACLVALGLLLGFKAELILRYFYRFNAVALLVLFSVIAVLLFFAWRSNQSKK